MRFRRLRVVPFSEKGALYVADNTSIQRLAIHALPNGECDYFTQRLLKMGTPYMLRPDFELEAFSRYHADVCLAALINRTAAVTNCPNEAFLSYLLRLPS